ncbi:MAG: hypothetical protein ACKVY0_28700 [Prosthecobacter sp.]|uniref:hypothetical protein n=1 Tax=Prosthecobacter sp. TaxID=1965333 RepID=UPI003900F42E
MPATTLVCPHCEKTVEIQVSSVTRSRPCPECGEMVMLQMAEKSTKTKRRALLMNQAEPPTTTSLTRLEPSQGPQPLLGDAFDRMRLDPEVQQFRRRLVLGAGVVGLIVIVILGMSLYHAVQEKALQKELFGPGQTKAGAATSPSGSGGSAPAVTRMIPPEDVPLPVSSGNLVFRAPGSSELKTATAMPARGDAPENLARLAAAEEVLGKFLQAANWKQRALLVRNNLRVAPLMSIYYAKNADGPTVFDSIVETTELSPQFSEHVVVFEGGGRRLATVEHTAEGPRVDWESFVGAGEMAWSDFLEAKPTSPTLLRVLVSPAGHFENQFGDPGLLKCYSLRNISEPGAKVVYGYVDKASALAKELDYWLQQNSDATVPITLRLKFPLDAPVDFQVWITHVVQSGWVTK